MASSSLAILVDEKRVNDLLKQKTGAKAFLRSACNLLAFIFFIVLFTVMAMGEPLATHRSFEAYIRHRFDAGAAMRLSEVNDAHSFYDYWNTTMIPGLYTNNTRQYTFPGATPSKMLEIDGQKANNRLFGIARVRMNRVKEMSSACGVQDNFQEYFPKCWGGYSAEAEDTEPFGPISVIGGPMFTHSPDAVSMAQYGWLASYSGGGFMETMDGNYSNSLRTLADMKEHGFVDQATRAVWFEWTIYNLNLGLYAVCRITFEISPVGGWLKTFDIDILDQRHLQPLGDKGLMAWMLLVMEAVLVTFVVRYLCEEASEFLACDNGKSRIPCLRLRIKWEYFSDLWNIIDWANLILMIVVMGYRMACWGISGGAVLAIGVNLNAADYTNLHSVVENVRMIRQLTAFNCVLTWFKAVKYISILPYIGTFMETMSLSWQMLFGWTAVFATSFMGFCLSYCTAFGESMADLRTVPRAFVFLLRTFIGNGDMRLVYDANPVIGSMLIIGFIVSMIFVNLNLFYAIIISNISEARQSQEMAQAKEWAKFSEKIMGFVETVTRVLQLEARFRGAFPGLWSRQKTWAKQKEDLERKRDERMEMRARMKNPHDDLEGALGSANPNCGRRRKREYKQSAEVDDDDDKESVVESEPDLGPLRFKEQLEAKEDHGDEHHHHHHHSNNMLEDESDHGEPQAYPPPGMIPGLPPQDEEVADRDEEAKELVLEATEHVVQTIKERCKGARQLVVSEMGEARQVLQGIGNVLEVLSRRARSLEAQQEQVLPPDVVARVKAKEEDEEEDMF